jgi:fido (protein-threonine AMPylation protein)
LASGSPSVPLPPFRGLEWTEHEHLDSTPAARALLAEGEAAVGLWLNQYAALRDLSVPIVTGIHRVLFEGVWPEFAGRLRGPSPSFLHTDVEFGGRYRGVQADDVPAAMEQLIERLRPAIALLDERIGHIPRDSIIASICNIAALLHCEIVRIHPFVNGNGRTARACINYIGVRYGMRYVRWSEHPRGVYIEATETYLERGIRQHFVDYLAAMLHPRAS